MKQYGVILADCPWQFRNRGVRGASDKHYPTMTYKQLLSLPVHLIEKDDCVLILWSCWSMQREALQVGETWGFEYVTGFPWIKTTGDASIDLGGKIHAVPAWGTGWWVRGCSEPVLVFRRGKVKPPPDPPLGLLCSKRFEHSRKPDNLYEYAERFPGPYIELFARQKVAGWDAWGNEVEGSIRWP